MKHFKTDAGSSRSLFMAQNQSAREEGETGHAGERWGDTIDEELLLSLTDYYSSEKNYDYYHSDIDDVKVPLPAISCHF
tara:strand:- start:667 stop:903 length:237 start_codon:yes stop_codon:yes gene_type:complete